MTTDEKVRRVREWCRTNLEYHDNEPSNGVVVEERCICGVCRANRAILSALEGEPKRNKAPYNDMYSYSHIEFQSAHDMWEKMVRDIHAAIFGEDKVDD
jgi:hypothetical protein